VASADQSQAAGSAGGRYALSGFYRQFLGAAAARLIVEQEVQTDAAGEECEVFFALEEDDEDAVQERRLTSRSGKPRVKRRLIQFKFSRDPRGNQFSPRDLNDIAVAFASSQSRANARNGGAEVTTEFIVASNRDLSQMSLDMIESAKGEAEHPKFQDKTQGKKPRLLWTKTTIALLAQIEWQKVSEPELRETVSRRAAELGVRPGEVDEAVKGVVQHFFGAVSEGGPTLVTAADLDRRLAGTGEARALLSDGSRQAMRDGLEQFRKSAWLSEGAKLHPRGVEAKLRDLIARRGLIFIYGEGGNGKTSLVYTVLESGLAAGGGQAVQGDPPFRLGCQARLWKPNVLAEHLALWRGDTQGKHLYEPHPTSLDRLRVAGGDPDALVLLLGLDALDEKASDTNGGAIEEILTWGAEQDARRMRGEAAFGVLIVTSRRHPRSFHPFYDPYGAAEEEKDDEGRSLYIDAFSSDELAGAVQALGLASSRADLEDAMALLIEAARQPKAEGGGAMDDSASPGLPPGVFGGASGGSAPLSASAAFGGGVDLSEANEDWLREIADSLRHPALWRCFCALGEEQRLGVLREEPEAMEAMSWKLLEWFKRKIDLRHPGQSYTQEDARMVLEEAATALSASGASVGRKREHWIKPATDAGYDKSVAEQTWAEALSAGLIQESARNQWFWRHPFFARTLLAASRAE